MKKPGDQIPEDPDDKMQVWEKISKPDPGRLDLDPGLVKTTIETIETIEKEFEDFLKDVEKNIFFGNVKDKQIFRDQAKAYYNSKSKKK